MAASRPDLKRSNLSIPYITLMLTTFIAAMLAMSTLLSVGRVGLASIAGVMGAMPAYLAAREIRTPAFVCEGDSVAPTVRYTAPGGGIRAAHKGDAGIDLEATEAHLIAPGERKLIGTGVRAAIPEGHVGMICSRSGLAHKRGLFVLNAPGIIDSGYRGEMKANLMNAGDDPAYINAGERIAQLVITPLSDARLERVEELTDVTERGEGGHGSTGV